jgi:hypothetical protein
MEYLGRQDSIMSIARLLVLDFEQDVITLLINHEFARDAAAHKNLARGEQHCVQVHANR